VIRVMIIDDHEIVREGLKTILGNEPDFEVVAESATADDVGELVGKANPNVILLDARLPGVSGAEACRQLATTYPDIAVLIVSTYSDNDLIQDCIKAGARGYVVKDIERFSLKESIRAVHGGGGAVSPAIAAKVLDRLRTGDHLTPPVPPSPLSGTQMEILRLIAAGFSNREIAVRVYLSENTVKSHVQEIFRKLDVDNRVQAALRASQEGWL
jgi:two-component system, NarL family, response regulator DevR